MTNTSDSSWVVLKFGGTSVSSVSNWKNVRFKTLWKAETPTGFSSFAVA
jgi:aspartokinase